MNKEEFTRVFPLGSHLCREPMPPMPELKRDMEILRSHGFNLVKIQEHWMIDEPEEGRYDFSRCEELIEHAATLDLGVYLGLTCEQAPHWLYEKHPDCRMVNRSGVTMMYEATTTLPADGKPGPCFDHPGAMADQERFITRLVETLGRFENIVTWNTWQEICYGGEVFGCGHVCYCDHTIAAYRAWLRAKYGDIDTLNRSWNSRHTDWNNIVPDRGGWQFPCIQEIDWRTFMDNAQIGNILRRRAAVIGAADPLDRPVFAHKAGPALSFGQDWTYSRCQGFLGCSCYPAWSCGHAWDDGHERPFAPGYALPAESWDGIVYRFDHIRSANPGKGRPGGTPVWVAEFQGGPVSTGFHKGRVPSPADIRRWMLSSVSSGVTGISFWVTRAEIMLMEQNGFSLLDSTGETTPRLEEAGRVGRALNRHADLFAGPTMQPAQVGILVGESNAQFCARLMQGSEHLAYSTRGWHRLLWDLNIPVDLVDADHDLEDAEEYKALILPFPLVLSEKTAGKLKAYVEAGGCLVSEAAPGRADENGYCVRGEMSSTMARLFGVRQSRFTMVREPDGGRRWSPGERTWGEYLDPVVLTGVGPLDGCRLQTNVYLQVLECLEDSEPVLHAGDTVAGVRKKSGDGHAWLLGTFVGHSGTAYRDGGVHETARALLGACDVTPQHEGTLIVRKRVLPGKEAWIFTNPTPERLDETLPTTGWSYVEDLLGETLSRDDDRVRIAVDPFDVRVLLVSAGRDDPIASA